MQYSFMKTLQKGLATALTLAIGWAAYAGLSDISLWALMEQYLKPITVTVTVGGCLAAALNFVKNYKV